MISNDFLTVHPQLLIVYRFRHKEKTFRVLHFTPKHLGPHECKLHLILHSEHRCLGHTQGGQHTNLALPVTKEVCALGGGDIKIDQ